MSKVTVRYVELPIYEVMCELATQGYTGDEIDAILNLPPLPSPQPRQATHEQPDNN